MRKRNAFFSASKRERGEIMLEGMIVCILTLFLLLWILAVGFVYYQRYVVTIVTNDAAVKIAATYNNPTSDIIMGYVTTEDLSNRNLYRGFTSGGLVETNQDRASAYIQYILKKANLFGTVEDVQVELQLVQDSTVRKHVQVTTTCTFNTPFGEAMELFGMSGEHTYQSSASADCTDMADLISTIDYGKAWSSGTFTSDTGVINSAIKLINTLVGIYNKHAP